MYLNIREDGSIGQFWVMNLSRRFDSSFFVTVKIFIVAPKTEKEFNIKVVIICQKILKLLRVCNIID